MRLEATTVVTIVYRVISPGTIFNKEKPVASFNSPMGQVENAFIHSLGFSVAEAMQRLVTDEVLHEVDARHIHRLLAERNPTARDAVLKLEQSGGSSSRQAVTDFRNSVIRLFKEQYAHRMRPMIQTKTRKKKSNGLSSSAHRWSLNFNQVAHILAPEQGEYPSAKIKPLATIAVIKKGNKYSSCPLNLARHTPKTPKTGVPVIENVCHHLAQRVAELHVTEITRPKVILVGRGNYNPIHKMHLRHFVIARQFLEERTRLSVLGGLLVPKHATDVRQRCRTRPQEIITPRHRLAMVRAAVDGSPWLTVDSWEITRRRILDYLSTLDHIRQLFEQRFPDLVVPVRFVLLVAPEQLLRLNLGELKDAGHECITICRPQEHKRLLRQMGNRWRNVAHVVEDNALLSAELESSCSSKIRHALMSGDFDEIATKIPGATLDYIKCHHLAPKMSGIEEWTRWDRAFADGEVRFMGNYTLV